MTKNPNTAWTDIGILQTKYGEDDLSYLFKPKEDVDAEIEQIIEDAVSVGMGC